MAEGNPNNVNCLLKFFWAALEGWSKKNIRYFDNCNRIFFFKSKIVKVWLKIRSPFKCNTEGASCQCGRVVINNKYLFHYTKLLILIECFFLITLGNNPFCIVLSNALVLFRSFGQFVRGCIVHNSRTSTCTTQSVCVWLECKKRRSARDSFRPSFYTKRIATT